MSSGLGGVRYGGLTPATIVEAWYDRIASYDWSKAGYGRATGLFTQVVWKNTTRLGTGLARSAGGWCALAVYAAGATSSVSTSRAFRVPPIHPAGPIFWGPRFPVRKVTAPFRFRGFRGAVMPDFTRFSG